MFRKEGMQKRQVLAKAYIVDVRSKGKRFTLPFTSSIQCVSELNADECHM